MSTKGEHKNLMGGGGEQDTVSGITTALNGRRETNKKSLEFSGKEKRMASNNHQ